MYSDNDYRYYLEHRLQESEDILMHYGVKGMKWRRHKTGTFLNNIPQEQLIEEQFYDGFTDEPIGKKKKKKKKLSLRKNPDFKMPIKIARRSVRYGYDSFDSKRPKVSKEYREEVLYNEKKNNW